MTIPIVNVGGEHQQILHATQLLPLPPKSPYGNLCLKWMKITDRLIRLNRMILQAYHLHTTAISMTKPVVPSPISELSHFLEEIVYWLRKTADELISLSFLCEESRRGNPIPTKVDIDSIGMLLNHPHPTLQAQFAAHMPHLGLLNDISNAYKHSFINSDLNFMGRDEPILYALPLQRNDLNKKEAFVSVALGTIVYDFDAFFQAAKAHLQTWPTNA